MSMPSKPTGAADAGFDEVLALINTARQQAVQAVNTKLMELYW